jgi:hypothetical protein
MGGGLPLVLFAYGSGLQFSAPDGFGGIGSG